MADEISTAVQAAIEIAKKLLEVSKTVKNAEMTLLMGNLMDELGTAKLEISDLKLKLAQEKEENLRLSTTLSKRSTEKPVIKDGKYSFAGEEGFFCPVCFENKGMKIPLSTLAHAFHAQGNWKCPSCRATF